MQEEISSRMKPGNACYHSVQNIMSSSLLLQNVQVKTYRTIILPVVLYELRVFENRVSRKIFGPERDKIKEERRKLHN
jgi:hypothetical protein